MKQSKTLIIIFSAIIGLVLLGLQHRTIASVTADPSGQYLAVTSYKTYLSMLPMSPGSSSDKPCFVKILKKDGASLGEIPVPMLQMADIEWSTTGASIKLVGEWDFKLKTCYHWAEDGNTKIYVK